MVSLSKYRNKILFTISIFILLLAAFYFINIPWVKLDIVMRAYQGDSIAQYKMGRIYSAGNGYSCTRRDTATALKWYLKAAEKGHPEALFEVGSIYGSYLDGRQLDHRDAPDKWKKADENSKQWYEAAAQRNHRNAQYRLALLYMDEGDALNTYKWLTLSRRKPTEKLRRQAFERFNENFERIGKKIKITEAQIAKAEAFIKNWKPITEPPPIDVSDLDTSTTVGCFGVPHRCPWLVWLIGY